jgi:hypothetical protein
LRKNGKEDFSPAQKLMAAVRYYCGLPVDYRIQLAREYAAQTRPKQ